MPPSRPKALPAKSPSPRADFSARARRFWDRRQRRAGGAGFSGYLLDESPPLIGRHRFDGEWTAVQAFLDRWKPGRGRCLDLGCGGGLWLEALARRFDRAEGWDYAPAMVRAARRRLKAGGVRNARVRLGDLRRRPGRAVFDFIFVGGVLMYTPEAELPSLLRALRRLLKPGGLLLLRESTRPAGFKERSGQALRPGLLAAGAGSDEDYVAVYRSAAALRAALAAAGLRCVGERPNRHYKFSDLTEDWLRRLARLGLPLRGNAGAAERWAGRIWAWRWLLLWPPYLLGRWELENRWFACDQAETSSTWKAR